MATTSSRLPRRLLVVLGALVVLVGAAYAAVRALLPPERVHAIVKAAFAQRRKTLGNALRQLMDAAAIEAAGIDPKARAETLAPLDFVRLAKVPTQA